MISGVEVKLWGQGAANAIELVSETISISISKGKTRQLDYYQPASAAIVFNNYSRNFDPTNTSSPYYPYIVPKQRIEVWSENVVIFSGLIDNWSFNYSVDGTSIAIADVSDFTSLLANQYLGGQYFPQELSGSRINRVLDDNNVSWSTSYGDRILDAGTQMLDAETISANTNALDYIRSIESSEQGSFFAFANKAYKFEDNSKSISTITGYEIFADDGSTNNTFGSAKASIPYKDLQVSYDTNLMYNEITVSSADGLSEATAIEPTSQTNYAINKYNLSDVRYAGQARLQSLATYLIRKYANPEYRFDSLKVDILGLGANYNYDFVVNTGLNKFCKVIFTPNGIGSAIQRFVRIIGISHDITAGSWEVTYSFESIKVAALVLDDSEFGKLDTNVLGL